MDLLKRLSLFLVSMTVGTIPCTLSAVTTGGWYWHSPTYTSFSIESVVRTPNGIIACGENGSTWIMDTNGQWTYNTTGSSADFNNIIYSNGKYYVTTNDTDSETGGIMSSVDGTNWQMEYEQKNVYFSKIIAANNLLWAFGTEIKYPQFARNGIVLSSNHNGTWVLKKELPNKGISNVIWAKDRFIAALHSLELAPAFYTIISSVDGVNWDGSETQIENINSRNFTKAILGVADSEVYVLFTDYYDARGPIFAKSSDGLNWSDPIALTVSSEALVYNNGLWVALDKTRYYSGQAQIATSLNLQEWKIISDPNWTRFTDSTSTQFVDETGILVAAQGNILSSRDGQEWTSLLPQVNRFSHRDTIVNGDLVLSVGEVLDEGEFPTTSSLTNQIYTGSNLSNLSLVYSSDFQGAFGDGLTAIAKGKNNYVAVGTGIALLSTDGVNWTESTAGLRPRAQSSSWAKLNDLAYATENSAYYATGELNRMGAVFASTDGGITWEDATGVSNNQRARGPYTSIAFGMDTHGKNVVAAAGTSIYSYNTNTINFWKKSASESKANINTIIESLSYFNDHAIYNLFTDLKYFQPVGFILTGGFSYKEDQYSTKYVTYFATSNDPDFKVWNFHLWQGKYFRDSIILGDTLVINTQIDGEGSKFYYTKDGATWYSSTHEMPNSAKLQGSLSDTVYATGPFNTVIEASTSIFDYNTVAQPDTSIFSGWSTGFLGSFVAYPEFASNNMWGWLPNHGFLYLVRTEDFAKAYWIYDPVAYNTIGWIYSSKEFYPFFYSAQLNDWLYYWEGSSNPRLFYSYQSNSWLNL